MSKIFTLLARRTPKVMRLHVALASLDQRSVRESSSHRPPTTTLLKKIPSGTSLNGPKMCLYRAYLGDSKASPAIS